MKKDKDVEVEKIIKRVVGKVDAIKRDTLGLLGETVKLDTAELVVYQMLVVSSDKDVKKYVDMKYIEVGNSTNKQIAGVLGISDRNVYLVRRRMIDRIYKQLTATRVWDVKEFKD